MKYLLETTRKKNLDHDATISFKQNYRMFEEIADLINHLFKNAVFIEKYIIHEVYSLKEKSFEKRADVCICGATMEIEL